jgi:preprotein translocase subunit SecD
MLDFPRWKIALILLTCIAGIYLSLPSFIGLAKGKEAIPSFMKEQSTLNLGLDLQGGSYLLLEVDLDAYINEQIDRLKEDIRNNLRNNDDGERVGYTGGLSREGQGISFTLRDPAQADVMRERLRRSDLWIDVGDAGYVTVTYTEDSLKQMRQHIMEQSIEIVRRRVDETGTRELSLQRQGDARILLQVPGLQDPSEIKRLLGKTAKLSFHLLDASMPYDNGTGVVPTDSRRLLGAPDEQGRVTNYIVKRQPLLTGEALVDAHATMQEGQAVVAFRFDNAGAKVFADVTKENVGRPFAIVLDSQVISAPVIREPIIQGAGIISGNFTTQSASELSLLLRAGALPAPLNIVEERTVGPSLGADSIASGKNAVILGFTFVVLVMVVIYKRFGVYACVGMVMNIVLLVALLSLLNATLTLPGIAGIVLTMGMSVDGNVLIFERIREEIRAGRSPYAAIESGFRHAFGTIMDSNLTTLIAALILYWLGSGPVKGFAVTLSAGIVTSMFSATLLTRFMIVTWLKRVRPKTLKV